MGLSTYNTRKTYRLADTHVHTPLTHTHTHTRMQCLISCTSQVRLRTLSGLQADLHIPTTLEFPSRAFEKAVAVALGMPEIQAHFDDMAKKFNLNRSKVSFHLTIPTPKQYTYGAVTVSNFPLLKDKDVVFVSVPIIYEGNVESYRSRFREVAHDHSGAMATSYRHLRQRLLNPSRRL